MGRIARMIQSAIDRHIVQTVEVYFGKNVTAETYAPSGDDSPPLAEDRIVLVQVDGTGNFMAVGVLSESQGAKPGEKILYSRNDKGEVQAAIKLLNDGKIEMVSPADFSLSGENVTVEGKKTLTLKSAATELTGGNLKCKGTATPDGTGCFCGMPYCAFTGAPQTGTNVSNA